MKEINIPDAVSVIAIIISAIAIWFSISTSKTSNYVNTITSSRIKYRDELKGLFSTFCGQIKWFILGGFTTTDQEVFFQKIDQLYFLAKLQLDKGHWFDQLVLNKMKDIINGAKGGLSIINPVEADLEKLTMMVKAMLDYEWQLAKAEAGSSRGKAKPKAIKDAEEKYLKPFLVQPVQE